MPEEYNISKQRPLFIKEPQDDLYGKQRKIRVLTSEELEEICKNAEHINLVSFSDNTLESVYVFDLIVQFSNFLKLVGVVYEPISQPIYCFVSSDNKYINIKICGQYSAWDIPETVGKIIQFADIPDIVICRFDKNFNPVVVIETTGTANVGNSQWQREGRKLGAVISNTPVLYQTFYSGTDRSQEVDEGQPREPTSLQVINHIIYTIRYRCPSFVIYFDNPKIDSRLGFSHSQPEGRSLIGNCLSLILLNSAFGTHKEEKIKFERIILNHMRVYLNNSVIKHGRSHVRLDNDFSVLTEKQRSLLLKDSFLEDFIIKRIYDKSAKVESSCNILDWNFKNFVNWVPGNIEDKPLIKDLINHKIKLLSYKKGISKVGICLDTSKLKQIIESNYNHNNITLTSLNTSLPTLIFPGRIWKGENKIESGDPESGELYAFRELFALDLDGEKTMNLLLYIFVDPPEGFKYDKFVTKNTKLTRSFKYNSDLIIINNEVQKPYDN
ncbi:MAG: hypothetical protein AUJ85_10010 [Elusimicrobia bacterium CG1_02_37_114]|nr:MAG: hypothetical protein AUJ85_10010 [Elusimicrobia bacterium CG1_02_37_114]PIV53382.1 MAG: hypothetical protein COS17_04160 [Elusimicrobia bacterium CG02_land_8_20_14_3_00_37_13]PIZ13482.1 MAG: hypothetical protein COY53_04575 [Elusimicrobia bacterium CG_4_10_14_0_8_um_filter_37_32]